MLHVMLDDCDTSFVGYSLNGVAVSVNALFSYFYVFVLFLH